MLVLFIFSSLPGDALTSHQIRMICKKQKNYSKCLKNRSELEKNSLKSDKKGLFTPTSIQVIPYKAKN